MKHFLTMTDLSEGDLQRMLQTAAQMKRRPAMASKALAGKTVALVFQKPSMRTRVAFEVAVLQLGGSVVYLGQDDIRLGQREPMKDVARALSRYVSAIVVRTFAHADAQEFAQYASVPVINGLSDLVHPCQALADLLTMQERFKRLEGLRVSYVGDGNNVLHSLLQGCAMLGMRITVATPDRYRPDGTIWKEAKRLASSHGGSVQWTDDPAEAVKGADVVYTDVWISMGQEAEAAQRRSAFHGYQVNTALLRTAKPTSIVLHCLPAHRGEEITDEVIESKQSLVFEQAENRLHAQKALLAFLLKGR